jgi:hypothetical protein
VSSGSSDITFGSAMALVRSLVSETKVRITRTNNVVCFAWDGAGFTLQRAQDLMNTASWSDVPGPVKTSPYCLTNPATTTFYRLRD